MTCGKWDIEWGYRTRPFSLLEGAQYPTELAIDLNLTKANVSNHLACLRGCGLVVAVPEGRRQRYEVANSRFADALTSIAKLYDEVGVSTCDLEVVG